MGSDESLPETLAGAGEGGDEGPVIGMMAFATYLPEQVQDAAYIAEQSGIPPEVVRDKLGIAAKRRAGPDDQTSAMAVRAARLALARAEVAPEELDLILYSGSMHKDFYVWSAANRIQYLLGAINAYAFELVALCTTNVLALKVARDLMTADARLRTVLICGGHRTADLINFQDSSSRFLFNLADGGSAMVLRRGYLANRILRSSFISDGSLAEDVMIPAGGTRLPTSPETLARGLHTFHVPDTARLKAGLDGPARNDSRDWLRHPARPRSERLAGSASQYGSQDPLRGTSEERFVTVVREAVERSGCAMGDIAFLAINHMKPSMHRRILARLDLREEQSVYLSEYGHIGAPDQVLALELARDRLRDGDLVVLASAGLGFTWGATALRWGRTEAGG